jgi:hypothetical protein
MAFNLTNLVDELKKRVGSGIANQANAVGNFAKSYWNFTPYGQILNPQSPTRQYIQGQVVNPIKQGVSTMQQPGLVNKAMGVAGIAGGAINATPAMAAWNIGMAPVVGATKAARTGQSFGKASEQALYNPQSLGSEGLGIKNPFLALGVDVLAMHGLNKSSSAIGKIAALDKGAVLSNKAAKTAVRILDEFKQTGTLSTDAFGYARKVLVDEFKMKPKDFAKLRSPQQIADEISALVTRNQDYVNHLPGAMKLVNNPKGSYKATVKGLDSGGSLVSPKQSVRGLTTPTTEGQVVSSVPSIDKGKLNINRLNVQEPGKEV